MSSLADDLARNSTLYRLNLAYNHFEDQGALHLAAALRLKRLDLSGKTSEMRALVAVDFESELLSFGPREKHYERD